MTAHTPGPWEVSTHFMHTQWVVESTVEHAEICQDRAWGKKYEAESLANARLIASAPELLDALIELCACPSVIDEATIPKAGIDAAPEQVVAVVSISVARLRKARAAIAKAKGEPDGR